MGRLNRTVPLPRALPPSLPGTGAHQARGVVEVIRVANRIGELHGKAAMERALGPLHATRRSIEDELRPGQQVVVQIFWDAKSRTFEVVQVTDATREQSLGPAPPKAFNHSFRVIGPKADWLDPGKQTTVPGPNIDRTERVWITDSRGSRWVRVEGARRNREDPTKSRREVLEELRDLIQSNRELLQEPQKNQGLEEAEDPWLRGPH